MFLSTAPTSRFSAAGSSAACSTTGLGRRCRRRLGRRILSGEQAAGIPIQRMDPNRAAFDARQLQRWGIASAGCLPAARCLPRAHIVDAVPDRGDRDGTWLWRSERRVSLLLVQAARRRRAEVALRASERRFRAWPSGIRIWPAA